MASKKRKRSTKNAAKDAGKASSSNNSKTKNKEQEKKKALTEEDLKTKTKKKKIINDDDNDDTTSTTKMKNDDNNQATSSSLNSSDVKNTKYFDLMIPLPDLPSSSHYLYNDAIEKTQIYMQQMLRRLETLGYNGGVAFTHILQGIPKAAENEIAKMIQIIFDPILCKYNNNKTMRILKRLHLIIDDETDLESPKKFVVKSPLESKPILLQAYDLISVMPRTQAAFSVACQTSVIDIITLDTTSGSANGLPFLLKAQDIKAAFNNHVAFEVCYASSCFQSNHRKGLIQALRTLQVVAASAGIRSLTSKKLQVIISSGPTTTTTTTATSTDLAAACKANIMALRSPGDVMNLAATILFHDTQPNPQESARCAIGRHCRDILERAVAKRAADHGRSNKRQSSLGDSIVVAVHKTIPP